MPTETAYPNLGDGFGNSIRMDENGLALVSAPGKPINLNGSGVSAAGHLTASLTLTPTQVKALTNAAAGTFVLVAAPGAGKIIIVDAVEVNLQFASAAYTTGTSAASLYYLSGATLTAIATVITSAHLLQASSNLTDTVPTLDGSQTLANETNAAVVIGLTTNATLYAAGDSPVVVNVVYRVLSAA